MRNRLPARTVLFAAILALVVAVGGVWLLARPGRPAPTAIDWSADLTTVAGDGERGHADGSKARFSDPFGLAIDAAGAVYVADAGDTNRVRRIDPTGIATTLLGSFATPSGIAVDKAGDVIVADTGANAIRRISPAGAVTTLAGGGAAGFRDGTAARALFDGPMGVAVDDAGNVFVADAYNDRIRVITVDGQVRTVAGGSSPGFADGPGAGAAFDTPCGVALDHTGALVVADTGNDAIRRVGSDGRVSTLAHTPPGPGGGMRAPIGLAPTWDGFLYISSFHGGRILQLSPTGTLRVVAGRDASVAGNAGLRLVSPAGLAIDRSGALYVADASTYAVHKLAAHPAGTPAATAPRLGTAPPAVARATRFPWPVKPQFGWHEVVGNLGEIRGDYAGESRDHLHAGLDIHAEVGEPVLAVVDEKVEDPLPSWDLDGLSEGLRIDALTYIHLRVGRTVAGAPVDPARFDLVRSPAGQLTAVRVRRGTRFRVGDVLGTDNRMAHVHLELGPPGGKVNPMMLHLPGLVDHVAPRIDGVQIIDAKGTRLIERRSGRLVIPLHSGPLGIVVDAWDQVDGDAPRRRLGLFRAGFQILRADGSAVHGFERPRARSSSTGCRSIPAQRKSPTRPPAAMRCTAISRPASCTSSPIA